MQALARLALVLALATDDPLVLVATEHRVRIERKQCARDADVGRACLRAVIASGAGDEVELRELVLRTRNHRLLLDTHAFEILHGADVGFHLRKVAHARKHDGHIGLTGGKA